MKAIIVWVGHGNLVILNDVHPSLLEGGWQELVGGWQVLVGGRQVPGCCGVG
jgi:hypothetical protein